MLGSLTPTTPGIQISTLSLRVSRVENVSLSPTLPWHPPPSSHSPRQGQSTPGNKGVAAPSSNDGDAHRAQEGTDGAISWDSKVREFLGGRRRAATYLAGPRQRGCFPFPGVGSWWGEEARSHGGAALWTAWRGGSWEVRDPVGVRGRARDPADPGSGRSCRAGRGGGSTGAGSRGEIAPALRARCGRARWG